MKPPAPCPTCGRKRRRIPSGKPYCGPCAVANNRKSCQIDVPEGAAVLTRKEVAAEMTRRGYKMTSQAVERTEKRALLKLQQLWKHDQFEFSS